LADARAQNAMENARAAALEAAIAQGFNKKALLGLRQLSSMLSSDSDTNGDNMIMKKYFPLLLLLATAPFAVANESFPGVKSLMEADEYQAAGLSKLTPEERDALNQWLIKYTAFEAPVIRRTNEEVKKVEAQFEATAHIIQPFNGWTGKTLFYLDNGEVWQQRMSGRYSYAKKDTAILINKNILGFHMMTLVATGQSIGVKRVR
jgi:hypothetical protein